METIVIPFAGVEGKSRLHASSSGRRALSLAMLGDVLAAAVAVGAARVVTPDDEAGLIARELGAAVVGDPGGGQGPAVAAALAGLDGGPVVVINADLPCVVPADIEALLSATPASGLALVAARDGTTNALGLSAPELFAPLYGADSAARFRAHASALRIDVVMSALSNIADDVDTLDDLQRLRTRCGARTQACLLQTPVGASQ